MLRNEPELSFLERFLSIFSKIRSGEGKSVVILFINGLLILTAYYILKTLREPLILGEFSAETRSYAIAVIAVILFFITPLYRLAFISIKRAYIPQWVTGFFILNLIGFYFLATNNVSIGFVYFVWVGIFGVMVIAQFWAYSTDLFSINSGQRLFPLIMIGTSVGALLGAQVAKHSFSILGVANMFLLAALVLLVSVFLYQPAKKAVPVSARSVDTPVSKSPGLFGGFDVVFRDRYLTLIALFVVLLNWINSTGEYILAEVVVSYVEEITAGHTALTKDGLITAFYADFIFWFTLVGLLIQLFVVSRIFRYFGVVGAMLVLPVLAAIGYGLVVFVPIFSIIRLVKIAENSVDYSLMNTTRQALFLPTDPEAKFEGKTIIDTFFWRFGDLVQAGFVYLGINKFQFQVEHFAFMNLILACGWVMLAIIIGREYSKLTKIHKTSVPLSLRKPIPDVILSTSGTIDFRLDPETFSPDIFDERLKLSAALTDGNSLPEWIKFNSQKAHFLGKVPKKPAESITIEVKATDTHGSSVKDTFKIKEGDSKK